VRLWARLVGVILAGLLLLPANAAWARGRTLPRREFAPEQRVPPKQWSHDVCTAVSDWDSTIGKASKAVSSDVRGASDLLEAKDLLMNFLGNDVQETDATVAEIREAGVPKMKNGNKIARVFEARVTDIRDLFAREQEKATQLPTSDPAQFKASATDIGNKIGKAGEKLARAITKAERRYNSPTLNDPACNS
jgi:hypothetical protein